MSQNTSSNDTLKVTTRSTSSTSLENSKKAMFSYTDNSNKISNGDFMVMLKAFNVEFLSSNKALTDL